MNKVISPLLSTLLILMLLFTVYSIYNGFLDDKENQRAHKLALIKEDNNTSETKALIDLFFLCNKNQRNN